MEFKWLFITMAVIMLGSFVGIALEQHEQGQCRIAALTIGMAPADIAEVCK